MLVERVEPEIRIVDEEHITRGKRNDLKQDIAASRRCSRMRRPMRRPRRGHHHHLRRPHCLVAGLFASGDKHGPRSRTMLGVCMLGLGMRACVGIAGDET